MSRSRVLGLGLLCIIGLPAIAKEIDLRKMSDTDRDPQIAFCARPSPNAMGFPGHAFVAFSEKLPTGARSLRAVGHTVLEGTSATAATFTYLNGATVSGKQAEEKYSALKQACLTLKVERAAYSAAIAAAQPTLTAIGIPAETAASIERYSLGSNDCVTFAEKVANSLRSAGLKVPNRTAVDTPASWIAKLQAANP